VLARFPGIAESRVDWSGKRFLLALDDDASRDRVGRTAASALGDDARLFAADEPRVIHVEDSQSSGALCQGRGRRKCRWLLTAR